MTTLLIEPQGTSATKALAAYDEAIQQLATKGPTAEQLTRVQTKMRSDWYDEMEQPINRASLIAHAALFDGNASRVNPFPRTSTKLPPAMFRPSLKSIWCPATAPSSNEIPRLSHPAKGWRIAMLTLSATSVVLLPYFRPGLHSPLFPWPLPPISRCPQSFLPMVRCGCRNLPRCRVRSWPMD